MFHQLVTQLNLLKQAGFGKTWNKLEINEGAAKIATFISGTSYSLPILTLKEIQNKISTSIIQSKWPRNAIKLVMYTKSQMQEDVEF